MSISLLKRKERIILTSIDLMNENGINSLSTKDIAKREGITEAAVFKYFPQKIDIYISVLDYFAQYDNAIFGTISSKNLTLSEAVLEYNKIFSSYYENYPAITVILQSLDEMMYNSSLKGKVVDIIMSRKNFLKNLIIDFQQKNECTEMTDPDLLVEIFTGTFNSICFSWRMSGYAFSLNKKCSEAAELLLKALNLY